MSGNVSNHVWVEDSSRPLGGYWVREKGTADGASIVSDVGAVGMLNNRQATAIGTTQGAFTWTAGYGPKRIRVRLRDGTSNDKAKIVFDAPSSALATTWLADVGSASTPKMYYDLFNVDTADANSVGNSGWTEYAFETPLENLYYVGVGTLGAGTVLEVESV